MTVSVTRFSLLLSKSHPLTFTGLARSLCSVEWHISSSLMVSIQIPQATRKTLAKPPLIYNTNC